ncbi:hypothetical protein DRE_01520 [Drechslerella stenobrocha 248]|uniref:Histone acetyltransferase GCN5 n=1 Tax=Drechslerella stenobrocha 248 TaxID=1043628 RepID=W7HUX0_9PEZI|nr:hypothetical protein DRE_01520 [Drechslerella stenobrocha 248]
MAPSIIKDEQKRKQSEDGDISMSEPSPKRLKSVDPATPETSLTAGEEEERPTKTIIQFKEKPAVIEERTGAIEFRVVANDNQRESMIILTGLKCIFQKQLPKMPRDYIARLVYDRTHLSMAIVKKPLEVVGGITYRPFKGRQFAEIVFCAISSDQQVKGYGAHLMSHLKDYVKATSDVMYFLTYADNYAIGYFKKQGFTKEITLDRSRWMGYIKDYEGGTLMQCSMLPRIKYLEAGKMLAKQKECVHAKIRAISRSHVIYPPPKQWKNGIVKIDPLSIPAIKESGWSPEMDELARQPKHAPHFAQLQHILNEMQNHPSAWPFQRPVSREDVADYYEVIKEPMDLETMENRLEADHYSTPEDFIRDAKLIFGNCRSYNNETTTYFKNANKLEKFLFSKLKEIPEWSPDHVEERGKCPGYGRVARCTPDFEGSGAVDITDSEQFEHISSLGELEAPELDANQIPRKTLCPASDLDDYMDEDIEAEMDDEWKFLREEMVEPDNSDDGDWGAGRTSAPSLLPGQPIRSSPRKPRPAEGVEIINKALTKPKKPAKGGFNERYKTGKYKENRRLSRMIPEAPAFGISGKSGSSHSRYNMRSKGALGESRYPRRRQGP